MQSELVGSHKDSSYQQTQPDSERTIQNALPLSKTKNAMHFLLPKIATHFLFLKNAMHFLLPKIATHFLFLKKRNALPLSRTHKKTHTTQRRNPKTTIT